LNNVITVKSNGWGFGLAAYIENNPNARDTNFVVRGNIIRPAGNYSVGGVSFAYIDNLTFEDNIVDAIGGFYDLGFHETSTKLASVKNNNSSTGINVTPKRNFFISPPDATIILNSGPSINVGFGVALNGVTFSAWTCPSNATGWINKSLPLPSEYWYGRTTFVSSWAIQTRTAGTYSFAIQNGYLLTDGTGGFPYETINFTAPAGTNVTTVRATNTIPTTAVNYLDSLIYLGNQTQPGDYLILHGNVDLPPL